MAWQPKSPDMSRDARLEMRVLELERELGRERARCAILERLVDRADRQRRPYGDGTSDQQLAREWPRTALRRRGR
jgi:hypothetical protein